ncbi:CD151 antigen-like isoform X3 [Portunus trituberculatus]|uniref:CD151 antigen-like isoform X3 n=1 Tax=Portunus trituberculatus TaxID=210409 RepID=UPI001E1CBC89|nr:CD151 antigen-like isoform X3 [Portunus trituberculatus]
MSHVNALKTVLAHHYFARECSTNWTFHHHYEGRNNENDQTLSYFQKVCVMVVTLGRCGVRCGKAVLLVFNLVFFVTGLAVIVVGVWCVAGDGRDVMLVLAPTPDHLPTLIHLAYGLVGAGGVVLLTSVLGVWAALKENKCGLGWYVLVVVAVISGEVAVGVLGVVYQLRAVHNLGTSLTERLKAHYAAPGHETFTLAVDYVQYQLQCCGVGGPEDWKESTWFLEGVGGTGRVVPLTCCSLHLAPAAYVNPKPLNTTLCQSDEPIAQQIARHQKGCVGRVVGWVQAQSGLITGVGVGVGVLEVAGLVAAASLCRAIRSTRD